MPFRQLTAASVILAAMSVMVEGAWAETLPLPPSSLGRPTPPLPVHKAAYPHRKGGTVPADPASGAAQALAIPTQQRFEPAPTPNDEIAPIRRNLDIVTASPELFTVKTQFRGDGYPYGATQQGLDDKYQVKVPGVNLTVPLRQ